VARRQLRISQEELEEMFGDREASSFLLSLSLDLIFKLIPCTDQIWR